MCSYLSSNHNQCKHRIIQAVYRYRGFQIIDRKGRRGEEFNELNILMTVPDVTLTLNILYYQTRLKLIDKPVVTAGKYPIRL